MSRELEIVNATLAALTAELAKEKKLHLFFFQEAAKRTAELAQTRVNPNPFETAAREWADGCSCAAVGRPDECEECTSAYLRAVLTLLSTPPCKQGVEC